MSSDPLSAGPSPATEAERDGVLLGALEERLRGARDHAGGTASYALGTAVQLGLDRDECILVREAGRLHEVGKLYVRRELLATPETNLSPVEREEVAAHAPAGPLRGLPRTLQARPLRCGLLLKSVSAVELSPSSERE